MVYVRVFSAYSHFCYLFTRKHFDMRQSTDLQSLQIGIKRQSTDLQSLQIGIKMYRRKFNTG